MDWNIKSQVKILCFYHKWKPRVKFLTQCCNEVVYRRCLCLSLKFLRTKLSQPSFVEFYFEVSVICLVRSIPNKGGVRWDSSYQCFVMVHVLKKKRWKFCHVVRTWGFKCECKFKDFSFLWHFPKSSEHLRNPILGLPSFHCIYIEYFWVICQFDIM